MVAMYQQFVLSPTLLAAVVDVVAEVTTDGALFEMLCVENLDLTGEAMWRSLN